MGIDHNLFERFRREAERLFFSAAEDYVMVDETEASFSALENLAERQTLKIRVSLRLDSIRSDPHHTESAAPDGLAATTRTRK